jgi:hypothetical protein
MKQAMVGGAAVTAFPTIFLRKTAAGYAPGSPVHPHLDPLRVAAVTDPRMTSRMEPTCSWVEQEALVEREVVWENIDRLSCTLTGEKNPAQAWRTIFVRPPGKLWSETVVAVKTNHIAQQHTRSAVMSKICHTLAGVLGVRPFNIHIYDACHGDGMSRETPFSGLPEGCRIEDRWGGSTVTTALPAPWKNGGGKSRCLKHLVDGSVDILINISMCKGHSSRFGGFTMTMKNHLGTFSPRPAHRAGNQDYLIAINKSQEILGQMDPKSGKILYPRQQLCFVDALWASEGGPGGHPTHQPNFLAMGVLSPVVDYQVATQFRSKKMGWTLNREVASRMLEEFGFREADLSRGDKFLEI